MTTMKAVGMSVRVLDKDGTAIAWFDENEFAPDLRTALLAFREKYPEALFIDVEFKKQELVS